MLVKERLTLLIPYTTTGRLLSASGQALRVGLPGWKGEVEKMIQRLSWGHLCGSLWANLCNCQRIGHLGGEVVSVAVGIAGDVLVKSISQRWG